MGGGMQDGKSKIEESTETERLNILPTSLARPVNPFAELYRSSCRCMIRPLLKFLLAAVVGVTQFTIWYNGMNSPWSLLTSHRAINSEERENNTAAEKEEEEDVDVCSDQTGKRRRTE